MPEHNPSHDHRTLSSDEGKTISEIYSFLALTMRYPDKSFCNEHFLDTYLSLLESLEWDTEQTELSQWRSQCSNIIDDLQVEYTRLFINSAPRTTVPPYASVYMDGDRNIQGKTTEITRTFYRDRGFDLADETEPADHIRHELEFLAALTREAMFADEELFLQTLFRPWFERFKIQSIKEARHPFFKVSIQLIDFFTKEEQ